VLLTVAASEEQPAVGILSDAGLTHAEIKAQVVRLLSAFAEGSPSQA
jgi:hypothetical protein